MKQLAEYGDIRVNDGVIFILTREVVRVKEIREYASGEVAVVFLVPPGLDSWWVMNYNRPFSAYSKLYFARPEEVGPFKG